MKTTLLNNTYSYHSHSNEVLKLKEFRIKNHTLDLNIAEECCFPPKGKVTLSVVPIYDRNK